MSFLLILILEELFFLAILFTCCINYVTSDDGLMKRIIKEETGTKYSSTNGNGVGVHYEKGGVREGEGEIVYLNDIRK